MTSFRYFVNHLAIGLFFTGILVSLYWADKHFDAKPLVDPPAGWVIETNGEVFRWKSPKYGTGIWDWKTRQDAVDAAWSMYEYGKRKDEWVRVK